MKNGKRSENAKIGEKQISKTRGKNINSNKKTVKREIERKIDSHLRKKIKERERKIYNELQYTKSAYCSVKSTMTLKCRSKNIQIVKEPVGQWFDIVHRVGVNIIYKERVPFWPENSELCTFDFDSNCSKISSPPSPHPTNSQLGIWQSKTSSAKIPALISSQANIVMK